MSRSRPARSRLQRGKGDNRGWLMAMSSIIVLMVVVVGWRLYQDSGTPESRFGVPLMEIEPTGGQIQVATGVYPELGTDGGALVVRSGRRLVFVVRISSDNYKVFDTVTQRGKPVLYDKAKGYFVSRKDPEVYFDRTTGAPLGKKVNDGMSEFLSLYTGSAVQITL
ncbi:MAG: hypothetical protein HYU66_12300 [Armatimonadetes bacterium]|nr:hypothetical protein [Armatimonadota bacterium]